MQVQEGRVEVQEGRVEVQRQDYPHLLLWLRRRFGEVRRAGNDFWKADGVEVVATLVSPTKLQLAGDDVFNLEVLDVSRLVKEVRPTGRAVRVYKVLHFCGACGSFYVFPTVMSQHEQGGDIHRVNPLVEGSYVKYVPDLPPFEQRKGWIGRDRLVGAFAKHVGPGDAETMADLRTAALKEGLGLSIQEMVCGTARIPEIVRERCAAHRDAIEATMCPPIRTKSAPQPTLGTSAINHPRVQSFHTLGSSFIDWKVKVNGQVLTPEQLTAAAVRLGVPYRPDGISADWADQKQDYTQVLDEAAKDADPLNALLDIKFAELAKRDRKLASAMRKEGYAPRRISYGERPSWKDRAKSPKSPRYEAQEPRRRPDSPPNTRGAQEPRAQRDSLEEERQAFLVRFNPEEVSDLGGGLVKAKTTFNSHSVTVFNTVFYPQWSPKPGEFPEAKASLAEEVAKATGGKVVVTRKRASLAFLEVVVDGKYTVRVASGGLSAKPAETPDPEKEKLDFLKKFSLKPAEVVMEKDGFIKASKAVAAKFGSGTLEVFNTVFGPQRTLVGDEFGAEARQMADLLSSKMGGSVVVTEDAKRGMKHLDVVFDGKYTVRVASARLSPPSGGGS
ncbi:MAG: hypothetical protein JRN45_00510 [Nitrososphaerota archaeon]|nr:hypothetical protein [Nitrososphaerota archaeon]